MIQTRTKLTSDRYKSNTYLHRQFRIPARSTASAASAAVGCDFFLYFSEELSVS